ncbi:MAG: DUF2147 domain-containing protein [Flavobacteriaceae bacterium]|nr:DUF2147 domain-containing protein [Flavobacteriaceae bacterium]
MKNLILSLFCMLIGSAAFAQSPIGVWKTVDDETGQAKSHVEITEKNGKLYGKVIKILTPGKENAVCDKCSDQRKNKPILGMEILTGVKKDGKKKWDDGKILDPNKGKTYDVSIEVVEADKLKVRGYMGVSMLGRTQYWQRVK